MASSSGHDVNDTLKQPRKRTMKLGDVGVTASNFKLCDRNGPSLDQAQVPLAWALVQFDLRLVRRVEKFHEKRAASKNEKHQAEALPWLQDCSEVIEQWKEISSGKCQFSELYMKSNCFIHIWTEGMRIIKEVLRCKQISSNQSHKRDEFVRIVTEYETLADDLQNHMVDAAHEDLLDKDVLSSIQQRWIRLDDTVKLHYELCNLDIVEDTSPHCRRSLSWPEVRRLVHKSNSGTKGNRRLAQLYPTSSPWNAHEPNTIATSKKVRTFTTWLTFFTCGIAPIPLFSLGYACSSHMPGSASDADFWFLILATVTQLQGLLASVLLEWERDRLPRWRWMLPAAVAGACSIMAITLYVHVPQEWSSLFSLVAGTTQSFIISQFFLS